MNTMIYEHEAIRLAEVTGRAMTRLPHRPREVVYMQGDRFNGKPCPFLIKHRCSVYEDLPMVCHTPSLPQSRRVGVRTSRDCRAARSASHV
jgi:Fe-S-cluster containining protein